DMAWRVRIADISALVIFGSPESHQVGVLRWGNSSHRLDCPPEYTFDQVADLIAKAGYDSSEAMRVRAEQAEYRAAALENHLEIQTQTLILAEHEQRHLRKLNFELKKEIESLKGNEDEYDDGWGGDDE